MMNVICFHNPNEENGYLSNWYPSKFTVDDVTFSSMEQYMMYCKANCFGDEAVAKQILATDDVAEIKALGRKVSNYDDNVWNGIRQIVVYKGLMAKFSQNEDLRAALKATGTSVLAECAVNDRIWGIGLSMKEPDRFERSKWRGQNLLGYALMMVRDSLYRNYSLGTQNPIGGYSHPNKFHETVKPQGARHIHIAAHHNPITVN